MNAPWHRRCVEEIDKIVAQGKTLYESDLELLKNARKRLEINIGWPESVERRMLRLRETLVRGTYGS